jgi:hypothetical protein
MTRRATTTRTIDDWAKIRARLQGEITEILTTDQFSGIQAWKGYGTREFEHPSSAGSKSCCTLAGLESLNMDIQVFMYFQCLFCSHRQDPGDSVRFIQRA